ncbi:DUF3857 domain-containing protein [Marinifilum caeruleilacunae]|uniref:DUF3857 domain-containing protein n=1 Tax=Marinifilum caeruleilacunae TaxID=2499076 RepID=A0ABX1WR09_9BACT|nr:DUF3857 domain-containing protein [Marinifilum caeruleilacunae]NOU58529.1 DUF3857 domain-containing protein [Marinifilum caeruleilacunae]
MNQLYFKRKAKFYFFASLFSLCSLSTFATDTISNQNKSNKITDADAYMLFSSTDVTYNRTWLEFSRTIKYKCKMVVNTRTGVDKYAFFNLMPSVRNKFDQLQINTLKADGSTVQLDTSLLFKNKTDEKSLEMIHYPIPGVEPGDTIHTTYSYTDILEKNEMIDFVDLFHEVPSLYTQFRVNTAPGLWLRYKSYNGFPDPVTTVSDTVASCTFRQKKVRAINTNQYTCAPCELPYLYYSIEKEKNHLRTWKEVYNQEFNIITQPIRIDLEKSSYYKKWKKKVLGKAVDSSKYHQFNLLHQEIINQMGMQAPTREEFLKTNGYFLKKKHFDPISIRRMYRQLLEDLEIKYWAVFARSKRSGKIDPYYIRRGEYDHVFFAYENPNNGLTLLYPHTEDHYYQINEIPTALYNTDAIIARPAIDEKLRRTDKFISYDLKMAQVDSVAVNVIKLPCMTSNRNFIKQIYYCNVNLEKKETTFKSRLSVSGGMSTDIRSFYGMLGKNKEMSDYYEALSEFEGDKTDVEIDSITSFHFKNEKPFLFSVNAEGHIKESVHFLNDSIVSISLENLLLHNEINSELDSLDLNYYLDFAFTDFCMYSFKFPCNVELISQAEVNKNFANKFGEYLFIMNVLHENEIILRSNYKIKSDIIEKNEYEELKALNELVKDIKNVRILVKLKSVKS